MQLINAALLFLALLLIWGTLNIDRSTTFRAETDQNTQLNDSMEFLRKLKRKSASEESMGRRMNAYRKTIDRALQENPVCLKGIEDDFDAGTQACESQLNNLIASSNVVSSNLIRMNDEIQKKVNSESADSSATVAHLGDLLRVINEIESSSDEVKSLSSNLNQQIIEVKSGVVY